MPGRSKITDGYPYGFNGKENDNEVKGEGNQQDYGMRIYDPRVGRFLSVDPLTKEYPQLTSYQFASNSPVKCIDLDGKEGDPVAEFNLWLGGVWDGLTSKKRWNEAVDNVNDNYNPLYIGTNHIYKIVAGKDLRGNPLDHRGRVGAASDFGVDVMIYATGDRFVKAFGGYVGNTWETQMNEASITSKSNSATPKGMPGKPAVQTLAANDVKVAVLAESSQVQHVYDAVKNGSLPGSQGAYLGAGRMGEDQIRELSKQYGVEFAQVYTRGNWKNGGGGYYTLYSGTANTVNIPLSSNDILINHTHPGGTEFPSPFDIRFLEKAEASGSPQKSSVILPNNKPAVRFNKSTTTSQN